MNRFFIHLRFILTAVILSGSLLHSQTVDEIVKKFTKGYHTYAGTQIPFHLFVPEKYEPAKKYPIVLCLHGIGERGDDDLAVRKNSIATVWARDTNQNKYPCLILVPQCPLSGQWVYSREIEGEPIGKELRTVISILDSITRAYSVDTSRIYITGLSMGGFGTWDLIARYPWKFAAAVTVCGRGDESKAGLLKKLPIWNFHGAKDNVVPVIWSRLLISALENAGRTTVFTHCNLEGNCNGLPDSAVAEKIKNGADLLYTEYQNGSHNIWDDAYNTNFVVPWLFSWDKSKSNTAVEIEGISEIPGRFVLEQNYPNPFNPSTKFNFIIKAPGIVTLKIFDLMGNEVSTILNEYKESGSYTAEFNASDIPSGVYFCRLLSGGETFTRKLLLLR